jgi:hypothetical protein
MKAMKLALLGTAALAAASVSARADNLSDLKAQIEALNARLATLESTPAMPAGYSMVNFSKDGNTHVISILPTADAPAAAATTITWTGYVRAGIVSTYNSAGAAGAAAVTGTGTTTAAAVSAAQYSTDVRARAGFNVTGKTDTAVGEVGASISVVNDGTGNSDSSFNYNAGNGNLRTDGYNGWWKISPNITLTAGLLGSLAKSSYTYDANCVCAYNDPWGAIYGSPANDPAAFKLGYADGPISFAVQLEDSNNNSNNSAVGVTARAKYSMDMISMDIGGGYWGNTYPGGDNSWAVSGGVGVKFDPVTLGVSVGTRHQGLGNTSSLLGGPVATANFDDTYAGGYAKVALGDAAGLELGFTHDFGTAPLAADALAGASVFNAAIYYTPVKQLRIGVEGDYQSGGLADKSYTAALVTWFNF